MSANPDELTVAVLGPGRLGETHVAALASLRDRGLEVDGRRVHVVPALYGRNAERREVRPEEIPLGRHSLGRR